MNTIKKIDTNEDIIKIRKVINAAFQTVAHDFQYTMENVPTFPAFIMEDILHKQMEKGLILFGYEIDNNFAGSIGIHDTGKHKITKLVS